MPYTYTWQILSNLQSAMTRPWINLHFLNDSTLPIKLIKACLKLKGTSSANSNRVIDPSWNERPVSIRSYGSKASGPEQHELMSCSRTYWYHTAWLGIKLQTPESVVITTQFVSTITLPKWWYIELTLPCRSEICFSNDLILSSFSSRSPLSSSTSSLACRSFDCADSLPLVSSSISS